MISVKVRLSSPFVSHVWACVASNTDSTRIACSVCMQPYRKSCAAIDCSREVGAIATCASMASNHRGSDDATDRK